MEFCPGRKYLSPQAQVDPGFHHPIHDTEVNYRVSAKTISICISPEPGVPQLEDIFMPRRVLEVIHDLRKEGWKWDCKIRRHTYTDLIQESLIHNAS